MGVSAPRPGLFNPREKTRYPLYRRLGGPQGRSGRVRKISAPPLPGFDTRTVQPVASRCNDWAIAAATELINTYLFYRHNVEVCDSHVLPII